MGDGGVRKAGGTSGSRRRTHQIIDHLGLASRFRAVLTGDDVVKGKPDPSIFYLAAEHLRLVPPRLLVVEDSRAGVRAGKSAGMKCLGIASGALAVRIGVESAHQLVPDSCGISLAKLQNHFSTSH